MPVSTSSAPMVFSIAPKCERIRSSGATKGSHGKGREQKGNAEAAE